MRRIRRLAITILATGGILVSLSAAAADGAQQTWLNWVGTGPYIIQHTGYALLQQAAAQPGTNRWGCANMWDYNGYYVYTQWFCGTINYQGETPYTQDGGFTAEPLAWNDWSKGQLLWGWEAYL